MSFVEKTNYSNHQIIVADNGSTDDSVSFVKKNYPSIQILDLQENSGFAGGYNKALKEVDADYFVLLNSDVEVTPKWLNPIVELMDADNRIGACQPKVLAHHQKDVFEYAGAAGGMIDKWGYPFCRGRIFDLCETDKGQYEEAVEVAWATGAAMVIRKEVFLNLGGFDQDYFAHMEEIDLCWRIQRAGYKIMCEPRSIVYHVGGGTLNYESPRKTYLNFRNSLFTIFKNETTFKLLWLIPLRLILDGVAGLRFLLQANFGHLGAIIKAHWHFFPRLFSLRNKRRHYRNLIEKHKIGGALSNGFYNKSIIWQYYILKNKTYKELK